MSPSLNLASILERLCPVKFESPAVRETEAHELIGEFLVRTGVLTPAHVEEILAEQETGDPEIFGLIAIRKGFVNDLPSSDEISRTG